MVRVESCSVVFCLSDARVETWETPPLRDNFWNFPTAVFDLC